MPALSTRRTTSATDSWWSSSPKSRHTMIAAWGSAARLAASLARSGKLLRVLLRSQVDGARGYDRRDGVLVDHLRDRVAQQHHVLVERLDLPLQLDAVHEIDRDRDVLFAQRVQKWVL